MSYQNNVTGLSQLLMAGELLGVHWEGSSSMGKPRILQVPVSVGQKVQRVMLFGSLSVKGQHSRPGKNDWIVPCLAIGFAVMKDIASFKRERQIIIECQRRILRTTA